MTEISGQVNWWAFEQGIRDAVSGATCPFRPRTNQAVAWKRGNELGLELIERGRRMTATADYDI